MNKFKIGQQVRVISIKGSATSTADRAYVYLGATFTISQIGRLQYRQNKSSTWCNEQDLALVNTTIYTRKPK